MYFHNTNLFGRNVTGICYAMKAFPQETDFRKREEKLGIAQFISSKREIKRVAIKAGSVPCTWYIPESAPIDRAVFYLHGGAYVAGRKTMDYSAVQIAKALGLRLLAVDYRLAPENPYPAALDDAYSVYSWLRNQGAPDSNISVLGDSAGGGLAAALIAKLRDSGEALPSSLCLFSPWLDLRCCSETYEHFTRDPFLTSSGLLRAAIQYANSSKRVDPYISPLLGSADGFPPTLIICGTRELLLDDSISFAKKLSSAGAENELHIWRGMFHDFPIMGWILREAGDALELTKEFIVKRMDRI